MTRRPALPALIVASLLGSCTQPEVPHPGIPIAILGDSDSHSYADRIGIAPHLRGGDYRSRTFQWTEILARLRSDEVDLGSWGTWGTGGRLARIGGLLGIGGRYPRKEDYEFNLAFSGATCNALHRDGPSDHGRGQLGTLLDLMGHDPSRWRTGLVIIRIGVNSFGQPRHLTRMAEGEDVPALRHCIRDIGEAVSRIRKSHPETAILLVGIFNNVHWAKYTDRWQDPDSLARISRSLDRFDAALASIAKSDDRIAFHDDRAWMRSAWGGRSADGSPDYGTYSLGGQLAVTNTSGDAPSNIVLTDGHFGTAANGLWLKSVVRLLNQQLHLGLTPITDQEILELVEPTPQSRSTDAEEWSR